MDLGTLGQAYQFAMAHQRDLLQALIQHVELVSIALAIAIVVCVPLGVLTARSRLAAVTFINGFNALRVIPSLAILFLALPYFGLTIKASLIALTVLALPPVLINTDAAFRNLDPAIREAAAGMGMSPGQALRRVEFPLALPVIVAGIRTATIEVIASATLAAFIGGGGLGQFITLGFAMYQPSILLVGAVPVALLALLAELGMSGLQRALQPPTA
jgi:osmoprotectant transport system permease protein